MTGTASKVEYSGNSNEAGSPCYYCQKQIGAATARVKIRVALFFDGTLNNRTNTGLGEKGINRGASYENALTNVAILELYYRKDPEYDHSLSIYIEGIGTEDDEADSSITAGTGLGSRGILGKVEKAITRVMKEINQLLKNDRDINCLHLDCFGFSRGAAAARSFIHSALLGKQSNLKLKLKSCGHVVHEIKVKFIGLFDTVASYGFNPSNDTRELNLDAIKYAEDVVQLAAAEEHRKHYPLTNISSSPHGKELYLPGAHSDIGGGYVDNEDENEYLIMFILRKNALSVSDKVALIRERDWLLATGWYYKDEIQEDELWNSVKATRKAISNKYHRIPLKMMAKFAANKGLNFSSKLITKYFIPTPLLEIDALINNSPLSSPEDWLNLNSDTIKTVRHDYLHFSARFGCILGCNDPQFTHEDLVFGHRKREVFDG
ncbi:hypothetical protein GMLC_36040 [Geomonas limicola]|uniref:T6SS Phospholipase effector Tle1-like catalytic domain-containing protein n=1 Tax=Geomonas limicola TaxID=2740186 RepID=A0A6V8NBM9_9BACT|nr:DUF2235 domain-containing protein [Geomonas limicola]GFO70025.1 hypothetical protein GMLC_36040 [Geomonas limicola]